MRLKDWIRQYNEAQPTKTGAVALIARKADLSYSTVFKIAAGGRGMDLETAQKISKATGGEVTLDELALDAIVAPQELIDEPTTGEVAR